MKSTELLEKKALNWFKKKYNLKEYGFATRDYETKSIIKKENRFKVIDVYPEKLDKYYFYVYVNKPLKEKKSHSFN